MGMEAGVPEIMAMFSDDENTLLPMQIETRNRLLHSRRKSWAEFCSESDEISFRRMFRMSMASFNRLCDLISAQVGPEVFRSENYLSNNLPIHQLHAAHEAIGGYIPGEVKLAMMLRLLAGASYLDLMHIFGVSRATIYREFHVTLKWVNRTFNFALSSLLINKDHHGLKQISHGFASFSNGIFEGIIGALDGIAIRITCPKESDGIRNAGSYWTRKQFYALNVQAICDSKKRFTWVSTGHQGSMHDSMAFHGTKLNAWLKDNVDWLQEKNFFLLGDSAYNISPYLLTPYGGDADIVGSCTSLAMVPVR
jgi:hypothetical protein